MVEMEDADMKTDGHCEVFIGLRLFFTEKVLIRKCQSRTGLRPSLYWRVHQSDRSQLEACSINARSKCEFET